MTLFAMRQARRHGRALLGLMLALFVAAPSSAADAALIERAEKIVYAKCFICHGIEGETSSQAFPRLAGQNAQYLASSPTSRPGGARAARWSRWSST